MEFLDSESSSTGTLSFSQSRHPVTDPHIEPVDVAENVPPTSTEAQSGSIQRVDSIDHFTETQIRKMQNDDAMAGGMVGMILTLAFMVFLFLTVGVNIWMQCFSR